MDTTNFFKEHFDRLQSKGSNGSLAVIRQNAFHSFTEKGIPAARNEEWKYTRISSIFNKEYNYPLFVENLGEQELNEIRLPGHETANELFFINGNFAKEHSTIRSSNLVVLSLEEASKNEYKEIVAANLGHSSKYLKDGINALNTAFVNSGIFLHVKKGNTAEHPVYIYQLTDARSVNILSQPRILVHLAENAQLQITEISKTLGSGESFTNGVMEIAVEKDASFEYYKIQNDAAHTNQVSTTHIRQLGKSYVHTVTLSLDGNIVRNNLNMVMEAEHSEAHLYGLYFLKGQSHIDNHTVVDNVKPHCYSNEFYKGILDDNATGVFNGKIFVQPQAQKTNAYQSNKNILLSDGATVNTKPQLEIFADDVKCSHGCTIGRLDEEGLFYLRSRGISEDMARALLVNAFAVDVLEEIKLPVIRVYAEQLISERLNLETA